MIVGMLLVLTAIVLRPHAAAAVCVGDCDGDGRVRIPEVQRCVNIRTGVQSLSSCVAADQDLDGSVEDNEVDDCIMGFLDASTCPMVSTPGPTNTAPAATATSTAPLATSTPVPTSSATRTATTASTPTRTRTATNTVPPTNTLVPTNTLPPATATPAAVICNFSEAVDNSDLDLRVTGNTSLGTLVSNISGTLAITCGAAGANGKRVCSCNLQSWTPANITGIGFVCISPSTCPAGEVDCDGGNALGFDALDDQKIGTCTSHAQCSTQCNTYCAGIGRAQWRSGCEGICQTGTRDNQPCICDVAGGGGCTGGMAGVNDCPGGSCVGKNNETDQNCQCQCLNSDAGGPSDAGDLQCGVGVAIKVVGTTPCTNPALVTLPPVCAPFTSQTTTGRSINANESPTGAIGPNTLTGSPETCTNFNAGTATGYELVSNIGFFDSTIGDLAALLRVDCQ